MNKLGDLKGLDLSAKTPPSNFSVNCVNNSGKICQSFGNNRQEDIKGVRCSLLPSRHVARFFLL